MGPGLATVDVFINVVVLSVDPKVSGAVVGGGWESTCI
jgi:hypothetical protein